MRVLLIWAIRSYQTLVSPALPRSCKYYPSCSQYAIDAVTQYGALRGFVLAGWRLMRCNPLSYGGYDPVDRQKLFKPGLAPMEPDAGDQVELSWTGLPCTGSELPIMKHEKEPCHQGGCPPSRSAMSRSRPLVRSRVAGQ